MEKWLNEEEAAKYLKMDKSTIATLVRSGNIPAHDMNNIWMFDVTELDCWLNGPSNRLRYNSEREISLNLLRLLSQSTTTSLHELLGEVAHLMREWSNCSSVGIRLEDHGDFPYFESRGFPPEFIQMENRLCSTDENGQVVKDSQGKPVLECMCGNIIRGRFNPSLPFFSKNGSFWTNSTSDLLASTSEKDRQSRTRNRCNGEGYESVALIPLRHGDVILGLLQFNDFQKGKFSEEKVALLENLASTIALAIIEYKAKETLQKSEARFRSYFESPIVGIAITSPKTGWLEVNDRLCEMLGYTRQELLQKTWTELTYPEDLAPDLTLFNQVLGNEIDSYAIDKRFMRKNGAIIWTSLSVRCVRQADGKVDHIIALLFDITERKTTEETLQQFKIIFDTINYGIATADLKGVLTYVNEFFAAAHGYKVEELLGQPITLLHTAKQMEHVARLIQQLQSNGRFDPQEVGHRRKDQTEFLMLMTGLLFKDVNGIPHGVAATAIDLTERKQLENQLLQAQKMDSIGRLAGGVAHDFNNMLGVILGHLDLIQTKLPLEHFAYANLKEIRKAAERSAELTNQLLTFARKQHIAPKPIDLNEVIENELKMLRRIIGENIDLVWIPDTGLSATLIDPGQVNQILTNLCINARDAITGIGKIVIETKNIRLNEIFCANHKGFVVGDYVTLIISDSGCGMTKETIVNIFEPFFTTKQISRGTGLGLAMVYGIIKQNNGFIDVYSEPGKGSTFKIYFPQYQGAVEKIPNKDDLAIVGGSETVLLVEDEQAILDTIRIMLENLGYTVITASTPKEALRIAAAHSGEIKLLITDVIMPEMNGKDLAQQLSSVRSNIKCLFMSGYTSEIITHQDLLEKGIHFIQKPFSSKDFAQKLREVLESED